ncbi:sulfotransferase family 2 domain-containing protein [Paracoccaceae bacterium Fryx2]|nr:sulfotransferase family 2 domain-containing protein [Paracoccaceae bacterium Fryx2]
MPAPRPKILHQSLRANRANRFIYLNNAKVGCSTVKASLWAAITGSPPAKIGNVHVLEGSPFDNDIRKLDWAADAFIFTFVRNPHARLVSAYLNKVLPPRDRVWPEFATRHGLDPDRPIGFDAFVEFISGIPPEAHDPHWRPQHINTLHPFVTPNFVGDLDRMDTLLPDLLARLLPGRIAGSVARRQHGTGAGDSYRSHLTDPGTVARMQRLYAGDFELFGYDPDPARDPAPLAETRLRPHRHPRLARLARQRRQRKDAAPG